MSKRKTKHKRFFATSLIKECTSCKGKTDIVKNGNTKLLICQSCGKNFGEVPPVRGAFDVKEDIKTTKSNW